MKILIVDDSQAIRTKLTRFLNELGHTVVGEASTGFEAIEEFRRLKPDLTTMDIVMPECDGIRAVKEIIKTSPEAKILMVTSAATVANMTEAKEAGALGFVVKPFMKETVQAALMDVEQERIRRAG